MTRLRFKLLERYRRAVPADVRALSVVMFALAAELCGAQGGRPATPQPAVTSTGHSVGATTEKAASVPPALCRWLPLESRGDTTRMAMVCADSIQWSNPTWLDSLLNHYRTPQPVPVKES